MSRISVPPPGAGSKSCVWCHIRYGPLTCTSTKRRGGSQTAIVVRHRIGKPCSLSRYSIGMPGPIANAVFPRNAAIPNAKAIDATTSYDDQTEVAMRIFQGDHAQVSHNDLLGDFLFSGLRPAPAGKARLEITFDVNIEGILTMSARDMETGRQMKTTVRVTQH